MADVEEFAQQKDLTEHIEILKKGAILAQSPVSLLLDDICAQWQWQRTLRFAQGHPGWAVGCLPRCRTGHWGNFDR